MSKNINNITNLLLQKTELKQERFFQENAHLLQKLVNQGQKPTALFITCADSRLVPESLFGMKPGEFFILRNAGNIIPPHNQSEISISSTLEFAIKYLQIPNIVICGHTECGAIQSLDIDIDPTQTPALARWIEWARPAQKEMDHNFPSLSPTERHEAIVEQNIRLQLTHLTTYPCIRQSIDAGILSLHAWIYNLQKQKVTAIKL